VSYIAAVQIVACEITSVFWVSILLMSLRYLF